MSTNYNWAPNQHIIMISEGSCDTEDWSNDAENSTLTSQKYITFQNIFKQKTVPWNCNYISQSNTVFTVFLIKWMQHGEHCSKLLAASVES